MKDHLDYHGRIREKRRKASPVLISPCKSHVTKARGRQAVGRTLGTSVDRMVPWSHMWQPNEENSRTEAVLLYAKDFICSLAVPELSADETDNLSSLMFLGSKINVRGMLKCKEGSK